MPARVRCVGGAIALALTFCGPLAAQTHHADTTAPERATHITFGAMAIGVLTRANPAYAGRTFTELQLVQPAAMANGRWRAVSFMGMLNAEGYTLRRGELNAGIFGEGYVDRRHPHTFVHELMVVAETPSWQPGESQLRVQLSVAAGRGFVPFGSDDPMMRPFEKYPVNHHHAQIIERLQSIGAARISRGAQSVAIELSTFNGDEPAGPFHGPRWERFGDSWAVRATAQPFRSIELSVSEASVRSPELQQGGAFDHRQRHAAVRVDREWKSNQAYLLAEWARNNEVTNGKAAFRYESALVEAAYGWRGTRTAVRFERTDRGEQSRLANPFRAPVGHVGFQLLGVTQWQVASVAFKAPNVVPRHVRTRAHVIPFLELSRAAPTPRNRPTVFEPAAFYGASTLWSVSVGISMHAGSMRARMGRYGVLAEQQAMGVMNHDR